MLFIPFKRKKTHLGRRYLEILRILSKYGFGELVEHSSLLRKTFRRLFPKRAKKKIYHINIWERIRYALIELGPTFIKLGQLLSNRRDIVPDALIAELEKLQDQVPPFPLETVYQIIEENLGSPANELFAYFYPEPEAAASMAQVHRAILPTGQSVAVKIKRPGIEDVIHNDIELMHGIGNFIHNNIRGSEVYNLTELINEFERQIKKELSFVQELFNIRRFQEDFRKDDTVVVPTVYTDYSTNDVLVMEFIEAKKISDIINNENDKYDKKLIAERSSDFVMKQLYVNGFFHADPHPGNFLVLEDNIICFIDFGMVYSLPPFEQEHLNYLVLGLVERDPKLIGRSLLKLTHADTVAQRRRLEPAIHDYLEEYIDMPLEYFNVTEALTELIRMLARFGIQVPARLTYVIKALITLEGISCELDPSFNMIEQLKGFAVNIFKQQFSWSNTKSAFYNNTLEFNEMILGIPETNKLIKTFLQDREVHLSMRQMTSIQETVDMVGFRLVFGLILSSLLISSSLVVLADISPKWNGIPIIGLIGFAIGGIMGILFLLTGFNKLMSWHKRLKK